MSGEDVCANLEFLETLLHTVRSAQSTVTPAASWHGGQGSYQSGHGYILSPCVMLSSQQGGRAPEPAAGARQSPAPGPEPSGFQRRSTEASNKAAAAGMQFFAMGIPIPSQSMVESFRGYVCIDALSRT